MTFQFSLPDKSEDETLLLEIPPKPFAGLRAYIDFLDWYCYDPGLEYLIYGWNVAYELTQLFRDLPPYARAESELSLQYRKWQIDIKNDKRQIVEFRRHDPNRDCEVGCTKHPLMVRFLDGMAFYKTSLDQAARMLGLGEKYKDDSVDRRLFTRKDIPDPKFQKYARRDAYITRLIGVYIQDQHRSNNVPTCISAPHFAATVFKTQFLKYGISAPDPQLEQAGLFSYHGGKNGWYLDEPTELPCVYNYDITSAYPEAMVALPDVEASSWKPVTWYEPKQHGLYCVTMEYNCCRYRGMQNHDGSWTESGLVSNVWITSYELDSILARQEANLHSVTGYVLLGPSGGPLTDYVNKYFEIKRTQSGPARETAKLLLNSLYGKFFQKQPVGSVGHYDLDRECWIDTNGKNRDYDYEAGGLYHPPIASLITGYVRAKIHGLEHKYESLMTSTDGLFGTVEPDLSELGKSLGQLTAERGRLRIWRERLYIFDGDSGKRKAALHGFHSTIGTLETIPLARGNYVYEGTQAITLKMSVRDQRGIGHEAGEFVTLPYTLRL